MDTDVRATSDRSSTPGSRGHYERDLFAAGQAAAEAAPHLAHEIRGHMSHLAARFSAGATMRADDIDVRTLVGLVQQAGVRVPAPRGS